MQASCAIILYSLLRISIATKAIPSDVEAEIAAMDPELKALLQLSIHGPAKGEVFNTTARFCDRWGYRLSGTRNLENSIDDLASILTSYNITDFKYEEAPVPLWYRGNESCTLLTPRIGDRSAHLKMLGLGGSVGSPDDGISADVLVVTSWRNLAEKRNQARKKIIVFAVPWEGYAITQRYRTWGATIGAAVGAVATLVRSVGVGSVASPHTGSMVYLQDRMDTVNDVLLKMMPDVFAPLDGNLSLKGIPKIPHAALTVEDTEMLLRMANRGTQLRIRLKMQAMNHGLVRSRNTIAEIRGWKYPEEVVLVSGHIDSWDVGQGAMDDAGPAFVALQALRLVKRLHLRPKRTLRWIGWTTEERGARGGNKYYENHRNESHLVSVAAELDNGVWNAQGIRLSACEQTVAIAERVGQVLGPINASGVAIRDAVHGSNGLGIDVRKFVHDGVPGMALAQLANVAYRPAINIDGFWDWEDKPPEQHFQGDYFFYHHTEGDTMSVLDSAQMDRAAATFAVHAYAYANLEKLLPRGMAMKPSRRGSDERSVCTGKEQDNSVDMIISSCLSGLVGLALGALGTILLSTRSCYRHKPDGIVSTDAVYDALPAQQETELEFLTTAQE